MVIGRILTFILSKGLLVNFCYLSPTGLWVWCEIKSPTALWNCGTDGMLSNYFQSRSLRSGEATMLRLPKFLAFHPNRLHHLTAQLQGVGVVKRHLNCTVVICTCTTFVFIFVCVWDEPTCTL